MQTSIAHIGEKDEVTGSASLEANYRAVMSEGGIRLSDPGVILMTGSESIDFLNRLSTNDLSGMKAGQHRTTILTNEKGRVIDLVNIICRKNDLLLLVSPHNAPIVTEWLKKFIIMEEISIQDVSMEYAGIEIFGPQGVTVLRTVMGTDIRLEPGCWKEVSIDRGEALVMQDPLWKGIKYLLLGCKEVIMVSWTRTITRSSLEAIQVIIPEVYESMRLERGIPVQGKELTLNVNPLEADLTEFVSFTKGCYIGQEVIARLDTYKKLQKKLTGFVFKEHKDELLQLPIEVLFEGGEVGFVTSLSWSFHRGRNIALGYVRTSITADEVDLVSSSGRAVRAILTSPSIVSSSNGSRG